MIAEGFYSKVFVDDNKIYKEYVPVNEYTQAAAELFACEADVMRDLSDLPYVPDVFKHNSKHCVMSMMPGSTLMDCNIYLLKESAKEIMEALDLFASIVYERGYLINDVHLGNILIDYDKGLSFVDFNSYIRVDEQADVIARHHHFKQYEEGYSGTRAAALEFISLQLMDVRDQINQRLKERGMTNALLLEWETC